jgi:hypothetical protein
MGRPEKQQRTINSPERPSAKSAAHLIKAFARSRRVNTSKVAIVLSLRHDLSDFNK